MFKIIKDTFLALVSFTLFLFVIYIFVGESEIKNFFGLDTSQKAPLSVVGDAFFDFGLISKDGVYKNEFQIKNNSSEEVRITDVLSTCACLSAEILVDNFKAGPFSKKDVLSEEINHLNIRIAPQKVFLLKTNFVPSTEDFVGKSSHKVILNYNNERAVEVFIRAIVGP